MVEDCLMNGFRGWVNFMHTDEDFKERKKESSKERKRETSNSSSNTTYDISSTNSNSNKIEIFLSLIDFLVENNPATIERLFDLAFEELRTECLDLDFGIDFETDYDYVTIAMED